MLRSDFGSALMSGAQKSGTLELVEYMYAKGQLISKCLFGVFNSPKKGTKKTILLEVP